MAELSKAVGQWIVENLGWTAIIILVLLSCVFKIAKKEIDPLGWLLSWVGKSLTKDVRKDVADLKEETNTALVEIRMDLDGFEKQSRKNCDDVSKRLDVMEKSNDMQTVRQIKAHVLSFANSCFNKQKHTKQDFENIIHENEEYVKLVKKYKLTNDVYEEDYSYIMKVYRKCQEEGSFLKESDAEA